jgi:hypothetical protein
MDFSFVAQSGSGQRAVSSQRSAISFQNGKEHIALMADSCTLPFAVIP